uniref:pleiotrophin-B-like n=1 Tax=Myxine glutinosa TaxID=7769 RepID=UPI00358F7DC2
MQVRWTIVLLIVLLAVSIEAGKKDKRGEKKGQKQRSDCEPWVWGLCIPADGDCGPGSREGTRGGEKCKTTSRNVRCKIPCNWKKTFGADCKYRFQPWGPCNDATHLRSRTGMLKQALFNAECHETVTATRECGKSRQPKRNEQRKKRKELDD